jgi:hypothetical protein
MILQNKLDEIDKLQKRYDEIEEWLIDNPFTHSDWQKHLDERISLNSQIETLNNDIKYN